MRGKAPKTCLSFLKGAHLFSFFLSGSVGVGSAALGAARGLAFDSSLFFFLVWISLGPGGVFPSLPLYGSISPTI